MAVPLAFVQAPSREPLPECYISHVCRIRIRVIVDIETVHRSSGIYLMLRRTSGNLRGDLFMKAMQPVIASIMVPCHQMTSVESHSSHGVRRREKGSDGEQ